MLPLVSIIIPTYNSSKYIEQSINSAIDQTYNNIEIIVSDNCSSDNTVKIVKSLALKDTRIRVYENNFNIGPVKNWEKCLSYCTGFYLKILWSDDLISNTFLEDSLPLFDEQTAFVLSGYNVFNDNGIIYKSKFQKETSIVSKNYIFKMLFWDNIDLPLSPGCGIFRTKDVIESLIITIPNNDNLIFENYGAGNDFLIFLITAKGYKKIKTTGKINSFFRAHPDSLSIKNNLWLYYNWARVYYINKFEPELLSLLKVHIFWKKLRDNNYANMYKSINHPLILTLIFKILFIKLKRIITNKIYNFNL